MRQWLHSRIGVREFLATIQSQAAEDSDRWILWAPVAFAAGILAYFALSEEPPVSVGPLAVCAAAIALCICRTYTVGVLLFGALTLAGTGFSLVKLRSDVAAAPVLQQPVGPIQVEGLVVRVERFPDRPRVTLEQVRLEGRRAPKQWPDRVLMRLKGDSSIAVGMKLQVLARLLPPPGPVEPGGYDYQRRAWFEGIGATGYALGDIRTLRVKETPGIFLAARLRTAQIRDAISGRIRATLPETSGALAVALIVGDRSGVPDAVTQALRDSGLAHLLAISGLHIGLVASIIFFAVRAILAAIEPLALRLDAKKVAASGALIASLIYLIISGATLPTQRAFVMGALVLCALLLDRKAISQRLVAVAAAVVLAFSPESVHSASFQMSFAAVIALVALYEVASPRLSRGSWRKGFAGRLGRYFLALTLTTLIAGIATGIIACYHFGRVTHYSLVANLLAIPLTAMWIMPMAVVASALMPFGLHDFALRAMGSGIDLLTALAVEVASWPGAVSLVASIPTGSFLMMIGGGLWLCLMRAEWRWSGLALMAMGIATVPLFADRPDILVSETGRLIAVRLPDGRLSLSDNNIEEFTAERWLRSNGQSTAEVWSEGEAGSYSLHCDAQGCVLQARQHKIAFVRRPAAYAEDCRMVSLVVSKLWRHRRCSPATVVVARRELRTGGAHAIYLGATMPEVVSANMSRGNRPWVPGWSD